MEEEEYVTLQDLLVKLRIFVLKELSDPNLASRSRDIDIKMIRSIDTLRKNTPVLLDSKER